MSLLEAAAQRRKGATAWWIWVHPTKIRPSRLSVLCYMERSFKALQGWQKQREGAVHPEFELSSDVTVDDSCAAVALGFGVLRRPQFPPPFSVSASLLPSSWYHLALPHKAADSSPPPLSSCSINLLTHEITTKFPSAGFWHQTR